MLTIPLLIMVLITPALFWFYGKRMLGSQTHPAAVFILAWISSSFLLSAANVVTENGTTALVWVTLNFAALAVVRKLSRKPTADSRKE